MKLFKTIMVMLVAPIVIDAVWIVGFMQGLYQQEIPDMLKAEANAVAALVFYVGYPLGAYYLAVRPALAAQSLQTALINGAVLGGVAYGTFAVTNLAVLSGWSVTLTVVDGVWGVFVTGVVSGLGYRVARP
mgnify:CR=1 FL=1